ncbi:MAG: hypothetical protein OEV37_01670 [Candidatus Berkelbacteria bacterium]|nr:hypothetical protein [Candidatus Berkelbacteria bacterium]
MSWFKKLTNKTKLVLAIGLTVGIAALAGAAYWIYKQQISASTFTYDKCTLNASITRDPNVTPYRYVHIFNAVNYQRLKENPSSTLTSIVRMEQSNPTATVPTILNQRYYAVIHKPNGTPVLDDNASFLCHSAKTIEIYADLNNGTIRVFSPPDQTQSGTSQNRKCIRYDYNDKQYIWVTKDESRNIWVAEIDQNLFVTDSEVTRLNEPDASKCGQQTTSGSQTGTTGDTGQTGAQTTGASSQTTSLTVAVTMNGKPASGFRVNLKAPGQGVDLTHSTDSSGKYVFGWGAGALTQTLYADVTVGDETLREDALYHEITVIPGSNQTITFTCTNPQEGSPNGTCSSSLTQAATQGAQPAVGAASSPPTALSIPLLGGGSNFPTGNNSVTFKAVRYSVAEEDPVQITLSGQGKQNFTHYTAVGGASFEITLLTAATTSKNTGLGAPIAYAESNSGTDPTAEGQENQSNSGAETTTGDRGESNSPETGGGPINTNVVTQTECEKDSMSEDVLRQIRRLRDIRSYRISGIIPDNGTKSALTIINLPDGSYKLSIRKNGFSSCSGYFHLEGGEESYIGGIPLLAKSSSVEPPSIEAVVSKIPDKDTSLGDVYLAQKSGGRYLYSSKCIRLGWVPEGQIGAMINTPLCQKTPQISQSGETIFTDENGNPLSGPGAEAVLANILNRCGGVNLNIFGGSSGSDRMSPLEAMLLGAAGGAFGAQTSKGEIVTKDVVYPAGFALIAALTGSDINIGVGNSCIGQSLPSSNYSSLCNRCLSNPQLFYSDPNCSRCYQQSWQNQIPWDVLGRSQSLINF